MLTPASTGFPQARAGEGTRDPAHPARAGEAARDPAQLARASVDAGPGPRRAERQRIEAGALPALIQLSDTDPEHAHDRIRGCGTQ
jgi:hypothetical protein